VADVSKETVIQFRLEKSLKKEFNELAKKKAINTSELLRQFIVSWIEKNK
jgi:ribbon-helix-helix protein, copG family